MSYATLLTAVRETLVSAGNVLDNRNLKINRYPNPPAHFGGNRFITIFPTGVVPGPSMDMNNATDEIFNFAIGITQRHANTPDDMIGERAILADITGLETLQRRVKKVLFQNRFEIIKLANEKLQNPLHKIAFAKEYDELNPPQQPGLYTNPDGDPYNEPSAASDYTAPVEEFPPQFIEPPLFVQDTQYVPAGKDWFIESGTRSYQTTEPIEATYVIIYYSGARRMQSDFTSEGVF